MYDCLENYQWVLGGIDWYVPYFGHVTKNATYVFMYTIKRFSNPTKEHFKLRTHIDSTLIDYSFELG